MTGLKIAVDGVGAATASVVHNRNARRHLRQRATHARALLGSSARRDRVPRVRTRRTRTSPPREITTLPAPTNTMFQLRLERLARPTLPDSQAGSAYYWHVRHAAHVAADQTRVSRRRCPTLAASAKRRRPSPGLDLRPERQRHHVQLAGLPRHQPGDHLGRRDRQPVGQELPDPGRQRAVVRLAHRHAGSSTRPPSPPTTGCTRKARTSGGCRRIDDGEPRPDVVDGRRRSPSRRPLSCRARRSAVPRCPAPRRSGGTPRRSRRPTPSRCTGTTT